MPANSSVNYYVVLGVARDASKQEINAAFKKLALKLHPDKCGNNEELIEQFRNASEAVDVLRDEGRRRKHDELLDRPFGNDPRLQKLYDLFGARPSRRWPTPQDNEYWTCRRNETNRTGKPREKQGGMSYDLESNYAHHASDILKPAFSKRPIVPLRFKESNFEVPDIVVPKIEVTNVEPPDAEPPLQPADIDRWAGECAGTNPEAQKEVFERCMMGMEARVVGDEAAEMENEEYGLKDALSTGLEGFDHGDPVSDIDEVKKHKSDAAFPHGSDCKCHIHSCSSPTYDDNFVDGEVRLSDKCHVPSWSTPSYDGISEDGGLHLSDDKIRSSNDDTIYSKFTESPQSAQQDDSASLTDEDSDDGVLLPHERSGVYNTIHPFIPFFQAKLKDPSGSYTFDDLHKEIKGLVLEAYARWLGNQRSSCPKDTPTTTPNDTEKCYHLGLWVKHLDHAECKICRLWRPLYVLTCSGCGAMACVGCKFQNAA
ncbi:Heat shock protein DnaJ N-terminal [Penicillium cinerascens]|uniref:Heat shock protein DnaJ N-terminal n=1 Tax=Penicillium cinerascens TaxID=70096 RepID=A0A9W9NG86_9EURO|nr:Heat shock protein DnaJ N-terminal [Penicillium cinerascens]KAJ5219352.1 Heat shock protein DnaJ N-terminal [Penicillium cinerascens]